MPVPFAAEDEPLEDLARRQGIRSVESVDDMARPRLFDSDEEWQEFLADLYASRCADLDEGVRRLTRCEHQVTPNPYHDA